MHLDPRKPRFPNPIDSTDSLDLNGIHRLNGLGRLLGLGRTQQDPLEPLTGIDRLIGINQLIGLNGLLRAQDSQIWIHTSWLHLLIYENATYPNFDELELAFLTFRLQFMHEKQNPSFSGSGESKKAWLDFQNRLPIKKFWTTTYTTPTDTNQHMSKFLKELWMPNSVWTKGLISTSITREELHQGCKQQKERIVGRSTGLSFSHHKAALEIPTLAKMDRIFRELPYKLRFLPKIWQSITDFRILKKLGVYNVAIVGLMWLGMPYEPILFMFERLQSA
jgi:hypothetical protein